MLTMRGLSDVSSSSPKGSASRQARPRVVRRTAPQQPKYLMLRAGVPFVLFSILASWVVGQAYGGKLREMEASQGKQSKSLRQAAMEEEHDEMMDRLGKIVEQDFDNTKRIKRPHEILEERRRERERKNSWHRRLYRWAFRVKLEDDSK